MTTLEDMRRVGAVPSPFATYRELRRLAREDRRLGFPRTARILEEQARRLAVQIGRGE